MTKPDDLFYIWGAGLRSRTPGLYQSSNLRIAAVIRPEIVPARMSASKSTFLEGRAVGFRLRRFFLPISTTPFLIIIIYSREYKNKMECCTNILTRVCESYILA